MTRVLQRKAGMAACLGTIVVLAVSACSSSGNGSGGSGGKFSINVGQVGAYTGQVPGLDGQGYGLEAWVKYTNAKGGIQGHKINLYTADSKGDPTTEVSQIQQLYTSHKVVAYAGMGTFNLSSAASFIASKKVPVIGGNTSDSVFQQKPYMYSPTTANTASNAFGFGALPAGKTKVGLVYCKESPGCTQVHTLLFDDGFTKAVGGDPVYSSEVSLASPSFTAQCVAARDAGVQVMPVAFDSTNLLRLAADCDKQNYHPIYAMAGTIPSDQIAQKAFMNGAIASQGQAPWYETGAVATMRQAMAKYESGKTISAITVQGWLAGVVLGTAIENGLKANGSKKLTSADILTGLGMIKNDTFGGLAPPITFTASGVQAPNYCYFTMTVQNGKWVTGNGGKAVCPSGAALAAVKALKA